MYSLYELMLKQALLAYLPRTKSANTKFQLSPVEHFSKVKKLLKKVTKLALSFKPSPVYLMKANRFYPKTLNKNKTKNSNPPIFASAGIVTMKVVNIILKLFALLTNLSTLAILKVLNIDVAVPMLLIILAFF
jgi:hypothetical protein